MAYIIQRKKLTENMRKRLAWKRHHHVQQGEWSSASHWVIICLIGFGHHSVALTFVEQGNSQPYQKCNSPHLTNLTVTASVTSMTAAVVHLWIPGLPLIVSTKSAKVLGRVLYRSWLTVDWRPNVWTTLLWESFIFTTKLQLCYSCHLNCQENRK